MRRTISRLATLLIVAACLTVPGARAQQNGEAREDAGFLEGLIQDALGGQGRDVQVIGLEGALSSQVSIAAVEIADDEGVWLRVEDIVLDWSRRALLRRRLEVETLSIGRIALSRRPNPASGPPPAISADMEATPFSLPELPVSVQIGAFRVAALDLGEPVIGLAATLSLAGQANLADGEGSLGIEIERLDGPQGQIALSAGFENGSRRLFVDLDVVEDEGGLIATAASIPGTPSLTLTVAGDAPIDDFTARIDLATSGEERLAGTVSLATVENDATDAPTRAISADVAGNIAELFLPDYQDFFGRRVALDIALTQNAELGLEVQRLALSGGALQLNGTLAVGPDGWPRRIDLTGAVRTDLGLPVVLPLSGPATLVNFVDLDIDYDAEAGDALNALIVADGIMRADGLMLSRAEVRVDGSLARGDGTAVDRIVGDINAALSGISSDDPALSEAIGDDVTFDGNVDWTQGGAIAITGMDLVAGDATVTGDVEVTGVESGTPAAAFDVAAALPRLARFAPLAGQPLAGALDAQTSGTFEFVSRAFDVELSGRGTDLETGQADADNLLEGDTLVDVSAARTADGLTIDRLSLKNPAIDVAGNATLGPDGFPLVVDLSGRIAAPSGGPLVLPIPDMDASLGSATFDVAYDAATGETFDVNALVRDLARPGMATIGRASLDADGSLVRGEDGALSQILARIDAAIAEVAAEDPALAEAIGEGLGLTAAIDFTIGGPLRLDDLALTSGDLSLTGGAVATGIGTGPVAVAGQVDVTTGSLARFAAISGQPLDGVLSADVEGGYDTGDGSFNLRLDGTGQDLAVGRADADRLLAGRSTVAVTAARDAAGIRVDRLNLTAPAIDISGQANIGPDNWPQSVALTGRIGDPSGRPLALPVPNAAVTLGDADIDIAYDAASGDAFTADIVARQFVQDGAVTIDEARLNAEGQLVRGAGTAVSQVIATVEAAIDGIAPADESLGTAAGQDATLSAAADWTLDGPLVLSRLSLVSGDLTVDGNATVNGLTGDAPLTATGRVEADTGDLGRFAALAGRDLGGRAQLTAEADFDRSSMDFTVSASGRSQDLTVGIDPADKVLAGDTRIVVDAARTDGVLEIDAFEVANDQLSVTADGRMQGEDGQFDLSARLANVGLLVPDFPGPLSVETTATKTGATWAVDGRAQGPGGVTATVTGEVLRPDGSVDLVANGTLPLGLANRVIAPRSIQGDARFDLAVRGQPGLDAVSGTITTGGARVSDPGTQIALEALNATIALQSGRAAIDIGANISSGGSLSVSGPVTLSGGYPADLSIALDEATLVDPRLYRAILGGGVTVTGPLTGGARIAGQIVVEEAEIKVPTGGVGAGTLLDVTHRSEPADSRATRRRAGLIEDAASGGGGGGGPAYPLDILISAPDEVYVRGRGLDAELGGEVRIRGTTANIAPSGGLQLLRGRLNLLTRRLDIEEASITLAGDLVPDLRLVASSSNGDIKALITIAGPVNAPEITLSSEPELPEDEVLAQLFFNKSISDLSPLELAQLAAAIRRLTGGGGPGLLERLRQGLGVDDLDVATDEDGNTQVTAGKYITERLYSDVTLGAGGNTEVQLNYDITPSFKARTSFDTDGDTGIGLHFERDY